MASVAPADGSSKLKPDPAFSGPVGKRKCTDVLFMLLLIACWVAMTGLGLVGLGKIDGCANGIGPGEPKRLFNGIDYQGGVCGLDNTKATGCNATVAAGQQDNTGRPYAYMPAPNVPALVICVASCPGAGFTKDYSSSWNETVCKYGVAQPTTAGEAASRIGVGVASDDCFWGLRTRAVGQYCVPSALGTALASAANSSNATSDFDRNSLSKVTADFDKASGAILGFGIGVAVVVGFVFLRLLRVPALLSMLVWTFILGTGASIFLLGVLFVTQANEEKDKTDPPTTKSAAELDTLTYFGYFWFALTAVYVCVIFFLRNRIKLAIGVVKEAGRAIGQIPAIIFFPVIQAVGLLLFMLLWLYYGIYLVSAGELVTGVPGMPANFRTFEYSPNMRWAMLYHLFSFYWTSQFIVAVGQLVVAIAVARWYFTKEKAISNEPFREAMRGAFFFHMGTAAFGSLIIAIIQTIQAVVSYIQRKAAKSGNKAAVVILCCIKCCLWCIKKCMQFLNKNAYIQTAIFGTSFCTAARKAFFLILRNAGRIAAVSLVGDFVLFLGKALITVGSAFIAYLYFSKSMADELSYYIPNTIFVGVLAYGVALVFIEVFSMAISTILQCFIADEELTGGAFAENDLKAWIGAHGSDETNEKAVESASAAQVAPEGAAAAPGVVAVQAPAEAEG